MKAPSSCSWTWRKLLNVGPKIRPFIKSIIGNGSSTYCWHDNWHPAGPLIDHYGHQFVMASGIPMAAKVSCVIYNEEWTWPFLSLPAPFHPNPMAADSANGMVPPPLNTQLLMLRML